MTSIASFSSEKDWENFNSSLLIEVTRPNAVYTCTGVAISNSVILTAAHCLDGEIKRVKIFTSDSYDPKLTYLEINSFKLHPKYNPSKSKSHADIAKIMMKEKLPSTIKIHPIYKGSNPRGNLYRFGFGGRDKKNIRTVITPQLRKMNLDEQIVELDDTFSKSGDSGGPIFLQNGITTEILAIHSTYSHGPRGKFTLNPLLAPYIPWIFDN